MLMLMLMCGPRPRLQPKQEVNLPERRKNIISAVFRERNQANRSLLLQLFQLRKL